MKSLQREMGYDRGGIPLFSFCYSATDGGHIVGANSYARIPVKLMFPELLVHDPEDLITCIMVL